MKCPRCGLLNTSVYSGKDIVYKSGTVVYKRYRRCGSCGYKFRTIERMYTEEQVHAHRYASRKKEKKS